jgi:hypothetical protein
METAIKATVSVAKSVQIYIQNVTTKAPVTGLAFGDFSPVYARREGLAAFSVPLTGVTFLEVDAANLPGVYEFVMSDILLGILGEIVFLFPALVGPNTEAVLVRVEVEPVFTPVDLSTVETALTDIQGAGFDTATDSLVQVRTTLEASLTAIAANVTKALGLSQENFTITGHVYDANGNLTQSTVTLYPSRDDLILTQNAIATYTMLASYDGSARLTNYSVRLDP